MRVTSIGSGLRRWLAMGAGTTSPTATIRTPAADPAQRSPPPRMAARDSRTRLCEVEGATTSTRWPRAASI